jgi:type VI secretion system protein ImpF
VECGKQIKDTLHLFVFALHSQLSTIHYSEPMPPIRFDQPLVPSVLDRLLDDDPGVASEPPRNRSQLLREMKLAVRRDIENLLNSRRRNVSLPPRLPELTQSLLSYGVADFSGTGPATSKQREAFCRVLEEIIRLNEPRLLEVRVELAANPEPGDRTLRFRIDALLRADPAPEPVIFDSALEPVSHTFAVQGG